MMKYNLKWLRAVLEPEDQVSLDFVVAELREKISHEKAHDQVYRWVLVIKEILGEETQSQMICKECSNDDWELVWFGALKEEGSHVNIYQCKDCKRIVMTTETWLHSNEEV